LSFSEVIIAQQKGKEKRKKPHKPLKIRAFLNVDNVHNLDEIESFFLLFWKKTSKFVGFESCVEVKKIHTNN